MLHSCIVLITLCKYRLENMLSKFIAYKIQYDHFCYILYFQFLIFTGPLSFIVQSHLKSAQPNNPFWKQTSTQICPSSTVLTLRSVFTFCLTSKPHERKGLLLSCGSLAVAFANTWNVPALVTDNFKQPDLFVSLSFSNCLLTFGLSSVKFSPLCLYRY